MKSWCGILAFLNLFWIPKAVKVKNQQNAEDVQRADNVSVVKDAHATLAIDSVRRHTFTISSSIDVDGPVQHVAIAAGRGRGRNKTTQQQRLGIPNQIEGDPMLARSVELVNGTPTGVLQSTARPIPNPAAAEIVEGERAKEKAQEPILPEAQGNGSTSNVSSREKIEPVEWGPGCVGYWSAWSDCGKECFVTRTWTDLQRDDPLGDHPCPDTMPPEGRIDTQNCHWGECPLQASAKLIRSAPLIRSVGLARVVEFLSLMAFPASVIMLLAVMVTSLIRKLNIENLPDGLVIMAFTAMVAVFFRFRIFRSVNFGLWGDELFNSVASALLLYLVLPISIFEGAYQTQRMNFWSEMLHGLIFAIFGVLFSAIIIACMVKASGDIGWHPVNTWREAFCYAAFIADTDPVATLAVFSKLKADALLTTLVAGEATLNDPVAIVIFSITNLPGELHLNLSTEILGAVKLLTGSIAIGIGMGLGLVLLFNIFYLHGNCQLERAYIFLCAFVSFHTGEFLGMSGIIACLFCGLMMGIYLKPNLAEPDKADSTLDDVARLMDSVTFVIVGIGVFRMESNWNSGLALGLLSIVFCLITRCIVVGGLMFIVNGIKKARGFPTVPLNTTVMVMHSGLRGAMTLMMALNIDNSWSPNKNHLIDGTMITVMGLMLIIGTTGPCMLRLVGVPMGVPQTDGTLYVDTETSHVLYRVDSFLTKVLVWQRKPAEEEGRANAPEDAAH